MISKTFSYDSNNTTRIDTLAILQPKTFERSNTVNNLFKTYEDNLKSGNINSFVKKVIDSDDDMIKSIENIDLFSKNIYQYFKNNFSDIKNIVDGNKFTKEETLRLFYSLFEIYNSTNSKDFQKKKDAKLDITSISGHGINDLIQKASYYESFDNFYDTKKFDQSKENIKKSSIKDTEDSIKSSSESDLLEDGNNIEDILNNATLTIIDEDLTVEEEVKNKKVKKPQEEKPIIQIDKKEEKDEPIEPFEDILIEDVDDVDCVEVKDIIKDDIVENSIFTYKLMPYSVIIILYFILFLFCLKFIIRL